MLILEIALGIVLGAVLLKALQILFDPEGIRMGIAKAMRQNNGRGPVKQGVVIVLTILRTLFIVGIVVGIIVLIYLIRHRWPSQTEAVFVVIYVVGFLFGMTWFIVHQLCQAANERWPKLRLHWGHTALWLSGLQTAVIVAICAGNLLRPMAASLLIPLAVMALGLARTWGPWSRHSA